MSQLIYDLITNLDTRTIKKLVHIEDQVEMSPINPELATAIYSLYEAEYDDGTKSKFLNSVTNSANVVIPATEQVLHDIFPEYTKERQDLKTKQV